MKTLIINPPNKPFSEKSLLIEPVDVIGLATYLQSKGNEVKFIDMDVNKKEPKSIESIIKSFKPETTIIPFDYHIPLHTTDAIEYVNSIGEIAKANDSKVIVGGKTSKYHPFAFLNKGVDVTINGEMEGVLEDLLNLNNWSLENLKEVKGISYFNKKNNQVQTTLARTDKINLNSLPITDRSFIDINNYIDVRSMLTSRGCFGKCSFCPTPDFWGNWNKRSAKNVVDEIEYLVKDFDAKKIIFLDDNATVNKNRMINISQEIIKRGIKTKLGCLGTAQTYDERTVKQMQEAGFRWIHYGGESGSYDILKANGKNVSPKQIKKAIIGTKNAGLRVRTSWIFDLPGTTKKSLQETIDLILETKPEEIRAHYLALRAGTKIYSNTLRDNSVPSQYIHSDKPNLNLSKYYQKEIMKSVNTLTRELEKEGYLVIKDVKSWRNIEKLKEKDPELRFISFCPSKYGINW